MEPADAQTLKRALIYIRAGNKKEAGRLLVEILKKDDKNEQAWFMLSFTMDEPKRQAYALQQSLGINPYNEKARARYIKITGKEPMITQQPLSAGNDQKEQERLPVTSPFLSDEPIPENEQTPAFSTFNPVTHDDDDLLSRRIFGEGAEANKESAEEKVEYQPAPVITDDFSMDDIDDPRPFDEGNNNDNLKKEKKSRKPLKLKRMILPFAAIVALVLLGVGYIAWQNGLLPFVSRGGSNDDEIAAELSLNTPTSTATQVTAGLPPTWTPTVAASPTSAATPLPPTATPFVENFAPEVLDAMNLVQIQVEEIRELLREGSLGRQIVSQATMEGLVSELISQGLDKQQLADEGIFLSALGLIDPGTNVNTYYLNQALDPIGGLYSYDSKVISLIGLTYDAGLKYVHVHEYAHALVEEIADVESLGIYPNCIWTFDQCLALRALVEGDATLVRQKWLSENATSTERQILATMDDLSAAFVDPVEQPSFSPNLLFPYVQGSDFVSTIHQLGGWDAVNEAYLAPPTSTSQIMHPEKYFDGVEPEFVSDPSLSSILGDDWREIKSTTLGEWTTFLILAYNASDDAQLDTEDASLAAEGWAGDHVQVYFNDTLDSKVLAAHYIFETFDDADEFSAAMFLQLSGIYEGFPEEFIDADCFGEGPIACMLTLDREVFWVMADDADTISLLLAALGF